MTDTFTITEAQLRNSDQETLIQFCLGLIRTANLHIAASEHIRTVLDETITASGQWPAGPQ